jgi:hypothetical protein
MSEFLKFVESVTESNVEIEKQLMEKLEASLSGSLPFKDETDGQLYKKIIFVLKDNKKIPTKSKNEK